MVGQNYKVGKKIGSGNFGELRLGKNIFTGYGNFDISFGSISHDFIFWQLCTPPPPPHAPCDTVDFVPMPIGC